MGGEISASNREKRGACLRVVLNPALPLTQQAARTLPAAVSLSRRARVLVVDDEQAVAAALVRVLSLHDVTAFNSAREALDLLATGAPFDIIFSDLMMPGISGDEFYESLSREHPELASRTVFMSGGAFTPTARAFLESVPNERIEKPFDISKVRQLVQKAVG
jgi:CheY-like chemotaxis protein